MQRVRDPIASLSQSLHLSASEAALSLTKVSTMHTHIFLHHTNEKQFPTGRQETSSTRELSECGRAKRTKRSIGIEAR